VTADTGVQAETLPAGLQINPATAKQISLRVPVLNLATGLPGVPTGGTIVVSTTGLPASLQGWTLSIGGANVTFTVDANSNILAVVPGSTPLGPTVLQLISPNGDSIAPILFDVDAQPPVIQAAADTSGKAPVSIDATHPAAPGDAITLDVTQLLGSAQSIAASSVHISVGGVDHIATELDPVAQSDVTKVQFTLASAIPASTLPNPAQQTMTVRVGTRVSAPFTIYVTPPPPATSSTTGSSSK
jgi:hypothetical protein